MRQRTHDKGSDFTNAREGASLPHCLGFLWCSLHRSFVSPTQTNTNTNKQTQANSFLGSVNGCFGLAFLFFFFFAKTNKQKSVVIRWAARIRIVKEGLNGSEDA